VEEDEIGGPCSTNEEKWNMYRLLVGEKQKEKKCSGSRWPHGTLYPQKLAITSPTSGGRSVGIVRSWTQTMEFSFMKSSVMWDRSATYPVGLLGCAWQTVGNGNWSPVLHFSPVPCIIRNAGKPIDLLIIDIRQLSCFTYSSIWRWMRHISTKRLLTLFHPRSCNCSQRHFLCHDPPFSNS
jgi:hypothetical protein